MNLKQSIRRILREEEDKYDDKVGKTFWFEYHCYESPASCDAEIWYRSHQKVKVIGVSEWSFDSYEDRMYDGQPRVYLVEWKDGFQYDVFEDELMESPNEFYRPNPPKRKIQESIKRILREEIDQRVINTMVKSVLDGTVQISKLDDYGLTGDEIREVRSQTRVEIINSILKIIKSNSIEKPYIENIKKIIRDLKTYTLLRTEDFNLILDNFFGENKIEKTSSGYDVYDNNGYKIYHESWSYWETYINNENGKRIYQINSSGDWKKWEYDKYGTVIYYETSDGKLLDKRPKKYY